MEGYLLSILIFLPILGSVLIATLPGGFRQYRLISLGIAIVQLLIAGFLFFTFSATQEAYNLASFTFVEHQEWFTLELAGFGKISADYLIGVDGLGLSMIVLSAVILIIASISSWKISDRAKGYYALFLLLNGAIIGCFVALDFLLFYLFFEFMLLPMYFLIGLWGGPRREYASIKFFLYTLFGSILILIVLIALNLSTFDPVKTAVETGLVTEASQFSEDIAEVLYQQVDEGKIQVNQYVHTFNMVHMANAQNLIPGTVLDNETVTTVLGYPGRLLAFILIFIGFAIKVPVVPFHTWLPDAHVEAPTPISIILAGILLKVGGYGLIRAGVLIFPEGLVHYSWWIGGMGVVSIIYGAMNALSSVDVKRLIAYSSVSHMGFVLLGIASLTAEGLNGAIYQMVSHGIISAALFAIAGVIYDRTHDRVIENYSGLGKAMPKYTVFVVIFFFASLGLPGFSGFIAEIFVLIGSYSSDILPGWMMIVAAFGLVLTAAYYLWTIQRMFFGPLHVKRIDASRLTDLTKREYILFIPLFFLAVLLGIFPNVLLDLINPSVNTMIELINHTGFLNLKLL